MTAIRCPETSVMNKHEILTLEDGADSVSRNVGIKLLTDAAEHTTSSKSQLHRGERLKSCTDDGCPTGQEIFMHLYETLLHDLPHSQPLFAVLNQSRNCLRWSPMLSSGLHEGYPSDLISSYFLKLKFT